MQSKICFSMSGFVVKGEIPQKNDVSYFDCSNFQVIREIGWRNLPKGSLLLDDLHAATGWKV